MIRSIVISSLLLICSLTAWTQQDQLYTQFMYNKLALNPAYAGHYEGVSFTGIVRNQWIGFPGAPQTQALSVNIPLFAQNAGLGITANRNTIGVSEKQTIEGAYTYRIRISESQTLSIGLQTSLRRYSVNFTDPSLLAIDGIAFDPSLNAQDYNQNVFNFGGGLYYSTESFYLGLSSPRLSEALLDIENQEGFGREQRIFYAMGGGEIEMSSMVKFVPQALIKYTENAPVDLDVNLSVMYADRLTGGINYRLGGDRESAGESIAVLAGLQVNSGLLIAAAYDITLSNIRRASSGSIEAVVHYTIGQTDHASREINPRFF